MAFRLVTGRAQQDHVTSDDMGTLYAATKGGGRYALSSMSCTVIDANTVRVSAGNLFIDGRHFRNSAEGTNLTIANGLPGMNRIDLVVVRYEYNTVGEDYLESGVLDVIQGTATSGTPEVPEYEEGSILNNDDLVEVPLFTIPLTGVSVGTPSDCLLDQYELPVLLGGTGAGTAAAARANLDAAQSEEAAGSLYDAEQAIADNAAAISTLQDSLSMMHNITGVAFDGYKSVNTIGFEFSESSGGKYVLGISPSGIGFSYYDTNNVETRFFSGH